jgi:vacuolar-type H+-ATPase subunit E/Vma4
MPLRDLLAALEEEGAAELEQSRRDRHQQAVRIIADAREQGAHARADAVASAQASVRPEAQSLVVTARADARRALRSARDDALQAVYAQMHEQLSQLPGTAAGTAGTEACVEEALAALPDATSVRVHPADAATLRSRLDVRVKADLTTGGAIAEDDEGRYVNNTYATRLTNAWPTLRIQLSRSWDEE